MSLDIVVEYLEQHNEKQAALFFFTQKKLLTIWTELYYLKFGIIWIWEYFIKWVK